MKRTSTWWHMLQKWERIWIIDCEAANNRFSFGDAYLPEGYKECYMCGHISRWNVCLGCMKDLYRLVYKADRRTIRMRIAEYSNTLNINRHTAARRYADTLRKELRAFTYDR